MINQNQASTTDDTTLDDHYEIARLDALSPHLRDLAVLHVLDQFQAVPSYLERFVPEEQATWKRGLKFCTLFMRSNAGEEDDLYRA